MSDKVSRLKDELADREAIKNCLYRYCRAADRGDAALLRTVYWPGAMDYHTGFSGTAEEFIAWGMPRMAQMEQFHFIGNILIELHGARALAETYLWSSTVLRADTPRQILIGARYLDKFEKRDDEWRIAERMVVHDWFQERADPGDWSHGPFGFDDLIQGRIGPDDKSRSWLGLGQDGADAKG